MGIEDMEYLFPQWTRTIGTLYQRNVLVRSRCSSCGIELRADLEALAGKLGPTATLIDRVDRCAMVGCNGHVYYLAARTYGRQWLILASDQRLRDKIASAPPPLNAVTLKRAAT